MLLEDLLARIPDRSARKAFAVMNALPDDLREWARARAAGDVWDWELLRAEIREQLPALPPIGVNGVGCAVVLFTLLAQPAPSGGPPPPDADPAARRLRHALRKEAQLSDFGEELAGYLR